MIRSMPPAFLQHFVLALLPARDQQTVAGDLLESYAEHHRNHGGASADLWYMRQALSLIPRAAAAAYRRTPGLALLCGFTAACGCWLGTMSILRGHGNVVTQELIAGLIVAQGMLTLIVLPLRRIASLRWAAALGALAVLWLGGNALIAVARGNHSFEGYILIIALLLVIQAALTWRALLRRAPLAKT